MEKFKNINTGTILTKEELDALHIREYTEMYNQSEELMDNETYSCKFESNMTLEEFIEYKKKHDLDNDFVEIEE